MSLIDNINNRNSIVIRELSNEDYSLYDYLWKTYRRDLNYHEVFNEYGIIEDQFLIEEFIRLNTDYYKLSPLREADNQQEALELILKEAIIRNNIDFEIKFKEIFPEGNIFEIAYAVELIVNHLIKANLTGIAFKTMFENQFDIEVSDKIVKLFNDNMLELKINYLLLQSVNKG